MKKYNVIIILYNKFYILIYFLILYLIYTTYIKKKYLKIKIETNK